MYRLLLWGVVATVWTWHTGDEGESLSVVAADMEIERERVSQFLEFMSKHKKREREMIIILTLVCCKLGTNRLNRRRECVSPF